MAAHFSQERRGGRVESMGWEGDSIAGAVIVVGKKYREGQRIAIRWRSVPLKRF